jgi:hypothetical protein
LDQEIVVPKLATHAIYTVLSYKQNVTSACFFAGGWFGEEFIAKNKSERREKSKDDK